MKKLSGIIALTLIAVLVYAGAGYAQDDTDDDGLPFSFDLGTIFIFVGLIINGGIIYAGLSHAAEVLAKKNQQ